jgi:hypothetical protein
MKLLTIFHNLPAQRTTTIMIVKVNGVPTIEFGHCRLPKVGQLADLARMEVVSIVFSFWAKVHIDDISSEQHVEPRI